MITLDLGQQLSGYVFAYLLILTRLGAAFMLFPGIGEAFVPQRIRALLAVMFGFLLFPVLGPTMPPAPDAISDVVLLLGKEALIGLFFGSILRLIMGTIETAGAVISVQIGLSNAMVLNPTLAAQSALPSAFLSMAAVVLVFMTGLDHMLLRGLIDTYTVFPVGAAYPTGDVVESYIKFMAKSFNTGVQLAAPFLISGLILYVVLGFMQRMMTQVPIFLVAIPLQIWGGLMLLAATVALIIADWLYYFDDSLRGLVMQ